MLKTYSNTLADGGSNLLAVAAGPFLVVVCVSPLSCVAPPAGDELSNILSSAYDWSKQARLPLLRKVVDHFLAYGLGEYSQAFMRPSFCHRGISLFEAWHEANTDSN